MTLLDCQGLWILIILKLLERYLVANGHPKMECIQTQTVVFSPTPEPALSFVIFSYWNFLFLVSQLCWVLKAHIWYTANPEALASEQVDCGAVFLHLLGHYTKPSSRIGQVSFSEVTAGFSSQDR